MVKLIKRTKFIILLMTIVLSVFIYYGIFSPMKEELNETVVKFYAQLASSKYSSLENVIDRNIQGAKSLSSRTMIKNKIVEYENQQITLQDLIEYTQPKYDDGVKVIENIVQAKRIVRNLNISNYHSPNYGNYELTTSEDYFDKIDKKFYKIDGKTLLRIISPITNENRTIGYDYVVYDVSEKLESLSDDGILIEVIDSEESSIILDNSKLTYKDDRVMLAEGEKTIYSIIHIQDDVSFLMGIEKDIFYEGIDKLVIEVIFYWVFIFLGLLVVIYVFIIRYANKKVERIENSKNIYKDLAYKDKATGTYSRIFLDVWNNTIRQNANLYSIAMIDIDDFKMVNDKYGHIVGDEVLKEIALTISNSVDEESFIIRYGGDEFILLTKNVDEIQLDSLMREIESQLLNTEKFDFKIKISYGISSLAVNEDFEDKLKVIDDRMYESKQRKKPR